MKLLIVRHGDPDYSIDSLTPTGWEEAELLSRRLRKLEVRDFYVSPLGRARDTAKATLEAMGREAQVMPWLREFAPKVQKPGEDAPGVLWDWLPEQWTQDPLLYSANTWFQSPLFAGVPAQEEYRWVCRELDALLASHGYVREGRLYRAVRPNEDTLVFFCHFGLECVLLSHLLGISPMLLWHGACAAPSSVTTLNTEERREGIACFRMSAFGDISHLYVADREPSFHARFCETYRNPTQRHD